MDFRRFLDGLADLLKYGVKKKKPAMKTPRSPESMIAFSVVLTLVFCVVIIILLVMLNDIEHKIRASAPETPTVSFINHAELSTIVMNTLEVVYSLDILTPSPPAATATIPTATSAITISNTPTWTDSPSPTVDLSFSLVEPDDGAELESNGFVRFSWLACPGAAQYDLEIDPPNGPQLIFKTVIPLYDRYLESMPVGGDYQWRVIARDKQGNTLYISGPFSFSKPEGKLLITTPSIPNE